MTSDLAAAVSAYTASVDALLAADVDACSHQDLLTAFADVETTTHRVPMLGYAILARLQREATPAELGATSWTKLLTLHTRMSKGRAHKLLTRATQLAPRRTLQGQDMAPEWEHTAAALSRGAFGEEHLEVIRKFFNALPATVDPITRSQAEQSLVAAAADLDPHSLTVLAIHLLALLHPDGEEPADAAARKAGLHLGSQQPDGLSYLSGWVTPKLRAMIEPILAKFSERGRHPAPEPEPTEAQPPLFDEPEPEPEHPAGEDNPSPPLHEDPSPPLLDDQWRTKAHYLHDAVEAAFDLLLRSQTLGRLNGLPTTVVITTTLHELHAGAGYAVTGGGSVLPMRDLIAMAAAGAYHYLAVFDGHTSMALHLGRAQRCATGAQKLALFGRERGCTCPGCDAAFYDTQAHHGHKDWKHGGQTNIDDLTLACAPANQMIEDTGWSTRRRPDGRFEWIDPTTGRAHLNNLHHPERLLAPREDDPPP
ncbi:DUF222 domain-containing protein [Mycobacterium frederiksbergense]|uniref:HNH endonuclease n=1 Tax=Mycolicibacterium frederiksbergense TaxID=117567 RepID=A0A6H0RZM0_9MYCO|nr:HNH endonuclease signature motif containing protein [Mycolicibacterium frederiksbergense]MCV7046949.1 DUF222 domain-containing protein [Mycolicibacterium frederiksbergense]QIV80558.1 HNH endonuclease [Mycolicibacterium frederiksbergense]